MDDDTFRQAMLGLQQTGEELRLTRERLQAALQAEGGQEALRDTVKRLNALIMTLIQHVQDIQRLIRPPSH